MTDEPARFPRPRRAESLGRAPDPAEGWYENLYHMLLGSMPFSVVLIDRGLKVASVNRNFLKKIAPQREQYDRQTHARRVSGGDHGVCAA